jgi:hypothetical protein
VLGVENEEDDERWDDTRIVVFTCLICVGYKLLADDEVEDAEGSDRLLIYNIY